MSTVTQVSREIAGRKLLIESGRMAKQAGGSVTVQYGETVVLACATMATSSRDLDFFPLTVDYREPFYAAGKYPGGFFKREARPSDRETLTSRCIDRPMRPLFPDGFNREVQVLLKVLSYDGVNDPDIIGMIAAFAAVEISDIPFSGPLGAVRIGRINGELIANPPIDQVGESSMNLTIAGSSNAIMMVEGGAQEEPEDVMLDALDLAQNVIRDICSAITELRNLCGKTKFIFEPPQKDEDIRRRVAEQASDRVKEATMIADKHERQAAIDAIAEEVKIRITADIEAEHQGRIERGEISADDAEALLAHKERMAKAPKELGSAFHDLEKDLMRGMILNENRRSDGRGLEDIRPITCEIGVIPRAHGSALFTRGQTQALVISTLGTVSDEQKVDNLTEEYFKQFFLHYNFPPFSVGEVRPMRGPGRREIGHGALAERALKAVIPTQEEFPYTVRLVSDILESNGSSSMASVCGGSLAMMDAGVPTKAPVAGIAMGLISDGGRFAVLSDILGVEDHLGDMDFKVTGTSKGITAFQMDLKIEGITREIMAQALDQARRGRLHILNIMAQAIAEPRSSLRSFAPRIQQMMIPIDKIRDVIGPSGKMIRKIIAETGAKIDIDDDGRVVIASTDEEAGRKAREWIEYLTEEVEVGRVYTGKVTRITNFGCFVEVLPGQEGLVHISELEPRRVESVTDVVSEGDVIEVKVIEIDEFGRINLSKKEADRDAGRIPKEDPPREGGDRDRGGRGDRDRGGRGGGGGRGGDRGGRGGGGGRGGDRGGNRGGGGGGDRGRR
ncbi:MAG: polyribonucleotide nucleotidyltransferase [bacterium]|nr:polyribonucleotide nucleotidyltransferase [bacterium]